MISEKSLRFSDAPMVEFIERGVALWRLAFQNGCELCDAVQRVHGNAGEAEDDGPLASAPRKCRNAVGGLGKTLEKGPKRRFFLVRHIPSAMLSFQHVQSMLTTPANNGLRRRAVKTCQRSAI